LPGIIFLLLYFYYKYEIVEYGITEKTNIKRKFKDASL